MSTIKQISRRQFMGYGAAAAATSMIPSAPAFAQGQEGIIMRNIPGTNEFLPAVGIGSPNIFYKHPEEGKENSLAVLRELVKQGSKVIDTPPFFRPDPPIVGALLTELGIQDDMFLTTKIPVHVTGKEDSLNHLTRAVENLNKSGPMDLVMSHNMGDIPNHWPLLSEWKEAGKIRYTGVSYVNVGSNAPLIDFMKAEKPDFIMIDFSILKTGPEEDVLPLAQDLGIATLIASPFSAPGKGGQGQGGIFKLTANTELPEWAAEYGISSWAQFALKYVVSHPAITCAIMETSTVSRIADNMGAAYGALPGTAGRRKMREFVASI